MITAITALCIFFIGCAIGSFISSLSYRLPKALNDGSDDILKVISLPRSYCPNCKTPINYINLIPLISYIRNKGRATCCNHQISIRYPIIEIAMGVLCLFAYFNWGFSLEALASITLSFILLSLFVIDLETLLLPDQITLSGIWLGLIFCMSLKPLSLSLHVWGVIIGYIMLWLLYQVHYRLTGRQGIGYGDLKLTALLGAWIGAISLPMTLLIASVIALVSYPLLKKHTMESGKAIPFGPMLCLSGWVMYHYGEIILNWVYG